MKLCQLTAAGILLLTAGCVSKQQLKCANQALERENFQLEECLNQARFEAEDLKAELETCRQQRDGGSSYNAVPVPAAPGDRGPSLRATPTPAPPRSMSPQPQQDDVDRAPNVVLPDEERSARNGAMPREQAPPFGGPPIISPPNPRVPEGQLPRAIETRAKPQPESGSAQPLLGPTPEEVETTPQGEQPQRGARNAAGSGARVEAAPEMIGPPVAAEPSTAAAADAAPTARLIAKKADGPLNMMAINPMATHWKRSSGNDAKPDELLVVVEPRNAAGEVVEVSGDVSVALLDPTQDGKNARVARWDFAADQLPSHFKGSRPGGGLHFRLAWPGEPPKIDRLELYVRLTLADGRQFVAESVLEANAAPPAGVTEQAVEPSWHRAPAGQAPPVQDDSQRAPQADRDPPATPRGTRWQTYR